MNWLEISVRADGESAEALSEVFNRLGDGGAVIEESPHEPRRLVVKTYLAIDEHIATRRRYLEEGLWHLSQLYPMPEPEFREMKEEDWANAWKAYHPVQHIGERIVIKPTWREYVAPSHTLVIELDPGMAFGTGQHPSTRLCLLALERMTLERARVLDVGTGSGILAIAAALLGAREVFGCDIDKKSIEVARENVALNHVEEKVRLGVGSLGGWKLEVGSWKLEVGSWDLIVINILAPVIIELLPLARPLLNDTGRIILSGLIETQEAEVRAKLAELGLQVIAREQEGDWVMLSCGHRVTHHSSLVTNA
jgi:ribosomal protein L11 methyltransferase